MHKRKNRRVFLQGSSSLLGGALAGMSLKSPSDPKSAADLPEANNPLVIFDNFHAGSRRYYSYPAKFASARKAGFDGFELVAVDPSSDQWQKVVEQMPSAGFKVWGLHWTTKACIDRFAADIEKDIEKLHELSEACSGTPIEYITLSLSGNDELRGETIHESGSARAEDRHWQRAYKIIRGFDEACRKNKIRGSLYPHTHWICDTPQSQQKILDGAGANWIGPAFCSHHWYANKASVELDEALALPMMQRLNYVVLTNGRYRGNGFPAVRFDLGEIDMAWVLAKIIETGYAGPISSQGWGIGGDPFIVAKTFVEEVRALRRRFQTDPDLWPLR